MPRPLIQLIDEPTDVSLYCANYIIYRINKHQEESPEKPFVLGLPTGSTPIPIYEKLIQKYRHGKVSFKNVITFNMDEYYPMKKSSKESYHYFMWTNFFSHIDIKSENVHILDGETKDFETECNNYEELIKDNPIDLFLGGIGSNGHLAFNEPGSDFTSKTRLVTLNNETITANSRFFNSLKSVPQQALTVGLSTIMTAKEIIIVATGKAKANVINKLINSVMIEPQTDLPISVLNFHPNASIYIDNDASSMLMPEQRSKFMVNNNNFDVTGTKIIPKLMFVIKSTDKVMFTSPHPDDDVLGCGGVMYMLNKHLLNPSEQVSIVYMTNGTGGLQDGHKNNTLRIKEAQDAVSCLGYNHSVIDSTMPFYSKSNRKLSIEDIDKMSELLENIEPNHIFVCCDPDPKMTHIKCLNILESCNMPSSVKHIWLYKSAWESFGNDFNIEILINDNVMEKKKKAIMAHRSQHQLIVNDGITTGLKDIIDGYTHSEKYPGYYTEKYKIVTPYKFHKPSI
jgi:glucosamine-6-phosphate deaminase